MGEPHWEPPDLRDPDINCVSPTWIDKQIVDLVYVKMKWKTVLCEGFKGWMVQLWTKVNGSVKDFEHHLGKK